MAVPVYVCVPVYNGGPTIRQTLHNLLQQTFEDFQVLVYDDGSTDRTAGIVGQFVAKDSRITLLSGETNLGRGAARNRLLQAARDGLIAWQDADDIWNPIKLEQQLAFFASFKERAIDPAAAVMISTFNRKGNGDEAMISKRTPPAAYDAAFVLGESYNSCPFQLQATLGLASVYLDAGGFDETLNWAEDLDIALRFLSRGVSIVPHRCERALATYHHSLAGAEGDLVQRAQDTLRDKHRAFALANGVDIDELFTDRRLTYLFSIYLNNRQYIHALSSTLVTVFPDEEAKLKMISRNIIEIFKAMIRDHDDTHPRG
ncbi:MAG: glycosyltransferase family 2 protein [Pseudomonadota bacterium]|nr:glycosyltransferase family 2 protein [Pseudomonadota bacterium]